MIRMADWEETKEIREQDVPQEDAGERLSPKGQASIQGNVDEQGGGTGQEKTKPEGDDDRITVHPRRNLEKLPSPEVEPHTVRNPEGGKPKPPEGWRPGGPERGG